MRHPTGSGGRGVDVVVLAGTVGHEAHWVRGVPRPALPLPGSTLIESLLGRLNRVFDGAFTVCANGQTGLIARHWTGEDPSRAGLGFHHDSFPRGSAGCLKDCESRMSGGSIFVAGGAVWLEDDPLWMVEQHRLEGNALTVFCTRDPAHRGSGAEAAIRPAGVYCCDPVVLKYIRPSGYQDLKEQLVPALREAGHRVGAVTLKEQTCEVTDWPSYMRAIARSLSTCPLNLRDYCQLAPGIWCGEGVEIGRQARIVGPALLGHRCRIADGSVVVGPTVLGDACNVGAGAWLIRVVAPSRACFPAGISVTDCFLPSSRPKDRTAKPARAADAVSEHSETSRTSPVPTLAEIPDSDASNFRPTRAGFAKSAAAGLALASMFVWAFEPTFARLWRVWQNDADYSAGQLVPLAALYMVVTRRRLLRELTVGFWPGGMLVFAAGLIVSVFGECFFYSSLENLGMVICANGLAMSLLGWQGYKRLWCPLVFLVLMLPLPHRIHDMVLLPLQGVGARISATVLETIGVPVARFGHVLEVEGHKIAVAEACSGLRMVFAFLIVTGVVAYVIEQRRWQKIAVLLSSIPIALFCNVVRIVFAAYMYSIGQEWLAQGAFHGAAGLAMMPVALVLVYLEVRLLSNLAFPTSPMAALVDRVEGAQVVSER